MGWKKAIGEERTKGRKGEGEWFARDGWLWLEREIEAVGSGASESGGLEGRGLGLGCSRSRAGPGRSGGSQGRLGLGADRDLGRRRKEGMARPVLGRRKKKKSRLGGGREMN